MMMWTAALVLVVGMTEKEALGMAEAAKAKALAAAAAARNDRKPDAQPGYMNLNNLNAQPGYMNYLNGLVDDAFHVFRQLDTERDGKLSKSEWAQHMDHHPGSEPHEAVDANSDGSINLREAKEYFKRNPEQLKPRTKGHDEL